LKGAGESENSPGTGNRASKGECWGCWPRDKGGRLDLGTRAELGWALTSPPELVGPEWATGMWTAGPSHGHFRFTDETGKLAGNLQEWDWSETAS
jgi:hypothetical protein